MMRARDSQASETADAEPEEQDGGATEAEAAGERSESPILELLIRDVEAQSPVELPSRIDGVVIGRLARVDASGPWVELTAGAAAVRARAIGPVTAEDAGREVALMFEGGQPDRPLVMGLVQQLAAARDQAAPQALDVQRDGERVVLSADKEIVLSCGEASITLTRAGKILIKGAYVSTRASGVNRIVGGTVEIN